MEAKIKLYRDSSCTKELTQVNGTYQLNSSFLASSTYTANQSIYIKNTGDHKAYNINITATGSILVGDITLPSTELSIGAVMKCNIPINIQDGSDINETINITINYDNIK